MLEGFSVRNYGVLKDVTIGAPWHCDASNVLRPMTAVIGQNGVGKTTLFDAFGFLVDAMATDVITACDRRGGFDRIYSQGATGPIVFNIYYRQSFPMCQVAYRLAVTQDDRGRPTVLSERLKTRQGDNTDERSRMFLLMRSGKGAAWKGEVGFLMPTAAENKPITYPEFWETLHSELDDSERIELDDARKLGVTVMGSFANYTQIAAFRRFIQDWHLSYFTTDAARHLPPAGMHKHLIKRGSNLANVVQYMMEEHPERFQHILAELAQAIPGIERIDTEQTLDGRLLLRFNDKGFQDPFYPKQVADGTLTLLTYKLLLADTSPPTLLCLEEPERGLYHRLLQPLANTFREYTTENTTQLFITTHSPHLIDGFDPREVWVLTKGDNGFATVQRATDYDGVADLACEEIPLGSLWYSNYLDKHDA